MKSYLILFFLGLSLSANRCQPTDSQTFTPNYEETKVPDFQLPELLLTADHSPITTVRQWEQVRKPELLALFATQMFGKVPDQPLPSIRFEVTETDPMALNGKATRKQVTIHIGQDPQTLEIHLLCFIPNGVIQGDQARPSPTVLGLNFFGNHSVHPDPEIILSEAWMRNNADMGTADNRATEASRGVRSNRWPVELILSEGMALVTAYYGDIDPDYDDGFRNGIHPLFYKTGQIQPAPDEWGSIAAWAWGLSRAMDYLHTDEDINADQVAVFGHSRLGKAALWAGATDERFALVISNDSGCGGAALSRRAYGETVGRINSSFPHWFCDNFLQYNRNEAALPFDQHQLLALMAPRPLYVASAAEDQWADPKGEFLGALYAGPVYELYGLQGLPVKDMPSLNQPIVGQVAYHIRSGKHDVTTYDWKQYLAFAKRHFPQPTLPH